MRLRWPWSTETSKYKKSKDGLKAWVIYKPLRVDDRHVQLEPNAGGGPTHGAPSPAESVFRPSYLVDFAHETTQKTTPDAARTILNSQPQIAYALITLMVNMNAINVDVLHVSGALRSCLHP